MGKSLEILILEGVRGLGPEIGNIDTGGVRAGSETDMAIWGMFILWGGWGSFGTNIGYVRGPGAEFGDVNIWGVRVGGLGQVSGMLILWDRHWGC